MKAIKVFTTLALMAMPLMLTTSCDDDDWYEPWYGDERPWWYDYDDNSWHWNDNDYNNGDDYDGGGYTFNDGSSVLDEADVLAGEWDGSVAYKYGDSGQEDDFYATFTFSRNSSNAIKGTGIEIDYLLDSNKQPYDIQTPLHFNWYIDESTGDIYIHYLTDKNSTFVMDISAKNVGFYLDEASGTFKGYMTGTNNNDLIYIDLSRQTSNEAKAATRAGGKSYRSFGSANSIKVIPSGTMRLNNRR